MTRPQPRSSIHSFWPVVTTEGIGSIPCLMTFITADSLEELDQFKASTQEVLNQIDKLDVSTSPEADGIHLRALRKFKCGTAALLAKACG